MKTSRFTDRQILEILAEREAGAIPNKELCRKHGISEPTFYRWKAKFDGMDENQLRKLKSLESEHGELKNMVADQALDIRGLKAALRKTYGRLRRSAKRCG